MPRSVRLVQSDELGLWLRARNDVYFRIATEEPDLSGPPFDIERAWGVFEDGRVLGTLRSFPTELTLPDSRRPRIAAVTNVTVLPTHRRQGLLRQMMVAELSASRDRGDAASVLIASEYPIYGRFGFGPATEHATWMINRPGVIADPRSVGSVELVDAPTARRLLPQVYEEIRCHRPGEINRWPERWDADLGFRAVVGETPWRGWVAIHRGAADRVDGYVRYHVDRPWADRLDRPNLVLDELNGVTPLVEADLWRFALSVDMVDAVVAPNRPPSDPFPWLLEDARAAKMVQRDDYLWLRPLDVPTLLSSGTSEVSIRAVIEVSDDLGLSAGRFAIEATGGTVNCRPTTAMPGLTLTAAALGAVLLGGVSLQTLASVGRVDVHNPQALLSADTLFRSRVLPFCSTAF